MSKMTDDVKYCVDCDTYYGKQCRCDPPPRVCRDLEAMREMASVSETETIAGDRQRVACFFPPHATVKQVMEALYWPKSWAIESADQEDEGGVIAFVCLKPEHLDELIKATLSAGGGFYRQDEA